MYRMETARDLVDDGGGNDAAESPGFDLLQPEQTLAETISVLAPPRGAAVGAAAG